MTLEEALKQREALGNERMRAQNSRHDAGESQFGVRRGEVRKLAKRIKTNHELALALWETGNIDARFLAILYYPVSKGCISPFTPVAINEIVSRQG